MLYSLEDLQAGLGQDVLAEGRRLADAGGLEPPNVQRGGELVTALIRGGGCHPLRVYVRVREQPGGGVRIEGECSCAVRRNCLHVAAVLVKALDWEQPRASMARLGGRGRGAAGENANPSATELPCLVYLLLPDAPEGVAVETFAARRRSSGYGEVRRYTPAWALRGVPPRFLSGDDLAIMGRLGDLEAATVGRTTLGEGELLARMLETGRCHVGNLSEPPLQPAAPRQVQLRWRMDAAGGQHPEWLPGSAAVRVLTLDSLWFLEAGSECGPLETGLPADLVRVLSVLPPVLPEQAEEMREELNHRFAGVDFPLPEPLELELLPQVPPTPCLRLESRCEPGGNTADLACLSFEYHGRRLGRSDPIAWVEGQRVLRLRRDEEWERAAIERLAGVGFTTEHNWSRESGGDCFLLPGHRDAWLTFQYQTLPELLDAGWRVDFGAEFRFRLARTRNWYADLDEGEGSDWFSLSLGVETDAGRVNLLPALVRLFREEPANCSRERLLDPTRKGFLPVPLPDGRLLALPLERLRPILETLFELHDPGSLDPRGRLRLNRFQLARLTELNDGSDPGRPEWLVADELRRISEQLRRLSRIEPVAPPAGLRIGLRDYQQQGLEWLQFLRGAGLAGILADDMGLGKTVQTLAHLLLEKEQGRLQEPALVVAPTSLMVNWRREAQRFAPELRVLTLHGPKRRALFERMPRHDLVLTTYPLLARDREPLLEQRFHLLILDEAQLIKNPRARASRVVRELQSRHRLCLTGTPMENHLGELWALFDFLLPGLLGSDRQFNRALRHPIEKRGDAAASELLARRVRPFMLRRTKAAVAAELPPKSEILRSVELEGGQRELYESIRLAMHERVRREVEKKGLARSSIVILDSLLKLRQVCCDPRLVKLESARGVRESAKLELLMTLLPEMVEEGRRILLFSQFTGMLALIEEALRGLGLEYLELTGSTRDRTTPVERFQAGEVPLFLISLKAGGVGLNLTAADTVIHYDPWWNPAVERQATDRAHRIGQDKPVFVYKLLSEGTVEERIQGLQARKQALADSLFDADGAATPRWSDQDLDFLFEPL